MEHEQPPTNTRHVGLLSRLYLKLTGVDEALLRRCPPGDWENVHAIGRVMLCTWTYLTGLFATIGNHLYAPSMHGLPAVVLVAAFLATFIIAIESQMIMRPSWYLNGLEELKRGGLQIPIGAGIHFKAAIAFLIRTCMALTFAQLSSMIFALILFGTDVGDRIQSTYRQQNASLIETVTAAVDARIKRGTDDLVAETQRAAALSSQIAALRQNEIDPTTSDTQAQQAQRELNQLIADKAKADEGLRTAESYAADELAGIKGAPGNSGHAGNGPRRRAALEQLGEMRTRVQALAASLETARGRLASLHDRLASASEATRQRADRKLPAFEATLAGENARVAEMKDELAALTEGREKAIHRALQNAPGYVAPSSGLLAQLSALDAISSDNKKIASVIILVALASFIIEIAAVTSKSFTWIPTYYSMLLARDAYLDAVRTVEDMMPMLEGGARRKPTAPVKTAAPKPANDNHPSPLNIFGNASFDGSDDRPPQPPKRPRGRPRKNTLN